MITNLKRFYFRCKDKLKGSTTFTTIVSKATKKNKPRHMWDSFDTDTLWAESDIVEAIVKVRLFKWHIILCNRIKK